MATSGSEPPRSPTAAHVLPSTGSNYTPGTVRITDVTVRSGPR